MNKIAKWALRRLKEKSTYVGLATIAAALGANKLGIQIEQVGQLVGAIVGSGLMFASTATHPAEAY